MFQLIEIILNSPLGAVISGAIQDVLYAALVISDCDECTFNDLGKLLFGGLILAVLVGIVTSIVMRRVKDKQMERSNFVSIRLSDRK